MAGSWTVVGSPKHAEKMLIQLISATAPSWPAVILVPCQAGGAWAGGQGTHFLSQLFRVPEMSWIYLASSRPRLSSGETQMVSCDVIVI